MVKKITLLVLAAVVLFAVACSDNDDTTKSPSNELTLNEITYNLVDGYVHEFGADDPLEMGDNTHFAFEIGVSDSDFELIVESEGDQYYGGTDGVSVVFYADIYVPTDSDIAGTYTYVDDESGTSMDVAGKYIFTGGEIELDDDNMVEKGDLDGDEFELIGGTITISGTKPNYTVELDVMTTNDSNMLPAVGTYTGEFEYLVED